MSDVAAGNILRLYERHAGAFARLRSQDLSEKPWLDKFIAAMGVRGRLLDIGCGNGQPIAEYFIQRHHSVTGIDGALAMLERARSRFPKQRWIQQDMREMALNETFDGLIAWDSFFHLTREDQIKMFPIFARHSHPGTALLFTSGPGRVRGSPWGNLKGSLFITPVWRQTTIRHCWRYRDLSSLIGSLKIRSAVATRSGCANGWISHHPVSSALHALCGEAAVISLLMWAGRS